MSAAISGMIEQGLLAEAQNACLTCISEGNDTAETLVLMSIIEKKKGNLDEAIHLAIEALCRDIHMVSAHVILADHLIAARRFADAIVPLAYATSLTGPAGLEQRWRIVGQALGLSEDDVTNLMTPKVASYIPLLFPHAGDVGRVTFKASILSIVIEISSYCNRVCGYCPNSGALDRHSERKFMDDAVFDTTIAGLKSIGYQGNIILNKFNEPMADFDDLVKRIKAVKASLPNNDIDLFSNGDYLTTERLQILAELGVKSLLISRHLDATGTNDERNYNHARQHIRNYLRQLQVSAYHFNQQPPHNLEAVTRVGKMWLRVCYNSWWHTGNDRGGTVNVASGVTERESPCARPFNNFDLGYGGEVMPCCNLIADHPAHKEFVIGKVNATNIDKMFEIFAGPTYTGWRRSLFDFKKKSAPCNTCNMVLANYDEGVSSFRNALLALSGKITEPRAGA